MCVGASVNSRHFCKRCKCILGICIIHILQIGILSSGQTHFEMYSWDLHYPFLSNPIRRYVHNHHSRTSGFRQPLLDWLGADVVGGYHLLRLHNILLLSAEATITISMWVHVHRHIALCKMPGTMEHTISCQQHQSSLLPFLV